MTEPSGILIINKHAGVTSHDIVGKVRRLFNTRRVGHTGTLDPLATGVLVVLIGRAAKAAEYLNADTKRYIARLRLGITTDTEDISGNILSTSKDIPSYNNILSVCKDFMGEIEQVPPMYSALKIGGQKLCDLARKGVTVDRPSRPVTIYSLDCIPTDIPNDFILDVSCSSGTYIRTLCADIGARLGCGGVMAELDRTQVAAFCKEDSVTVSELEEMSIDDRIKHLIPTEHLFDAYPAVKLSNFFEKLCRSGCEIYQKKIGTSFDIGMRIRICSESGKFFALGEIREYPNGSAIKALKTFDLN